MSDFSPSDFSSSCTDSSQWDSDSSSSSSSDESYVSNKPKPKPELKPPPPPDQVKDVESSETVIKPANNADIKFDFKAMTQNSYYRKFRNRLIISPEGKKYKAQIQERIKGIDKIYGKVGLILKFQFKDKRKRDLDNLHKCLIDALKNVLIEDDDQAYRLYMTKEIGTGHDCFSVRVVDAKLFDALDSYVDSL